MELFTWVTTEIRIAGAFERHFGGLISLLPVVVGLADVFARLVG